MGKKCIPGLFCIENMTLFILVVIMILLGYLYYVQVVKLMPLSTGQDSKIIILTSPSQQLPMMSPLATRNDVLNDPYAPPLKNDGVYFPTNFGDVRGIPVNVKTRGLNTGYQQVGILTRSGDQILPLMGRKIMSGRDKWQYYTISNTGNMNTKLPISLNGKSCTSEYGCDDINNGDMVYVEGYNDTFRVTMYENNLFQYIA